MNKYTYPDYYRFEEKVYRLAFKYINKWWDVDDTDFRRDEYRGVIFNNLNKELNDLIELYGLQNDLYTCFIFGKDFKLIEIDITFEKGCKRFNYE